MLSVIGLSGRMVPDRLGFTAPSSWLVTIGLAAVWLILMLACSPLADRLSTRVTSKPPNLGAFRSVQRSPLGLVLGIVMAWVLGGFLEETLLRGIVLRSSYTVLAARIAAPLAAISAILMAAFIAVLLHLYQRPRGALIVGQLSILFGVLYVVSDQNLWAVIMCHGMYDTIAITRFARRQSKYSQLAVDKPLDVGE